MVESENLNPNKMKNNKTLKAIALSLGLAVMTLSATNLNAQNGGGLFSRGMTADNAEQNGRGMMNVNSDTESGITNADFGEEAPLGSGIAIMLAAGLGYVALKKKED